MSHEETSNSKGIRRLNSSEISPVSVFAYYSPFFLSSFLLLSMVKNTHITAHSVSPLNWSVQIKVASLICCMFQGGKPDWLFLG